jgi:hypothetical protein
MSRQRLMYNKYQKEEAVRSFPSVKNGVLARLSYGRSQTPKVDELFPSCPQQQNRSSKSGRRPLPGMMEQPFNCACPVDALGLCSNTGYVSLVTQRLECMSDQRPPR